MSEAIQNQTPEKPKLTGKQKIFVEAYLGEARFNATEAARIACYKGNDKTLAQVGYLNLRKREIAEVVAARIDEAAMSVNEILSRLSKQARASFAQVLTDEGKFDLDYAKAQGTDDLVKKLKTRTSTRRTRDGEEIEDVTYEYELHDSQAALVRLGKYHKLFTEKLEHSNPDGTPLMQPVSDAILKIYGNVAK